ncbi:DUF3899 domain-containing protein [Ligilactobacillus pobuzihii]|nr:DUF3899 domain-containing protein [Ligilactobacillus pobuzihii]
MTNFKSKLMYKLDMITVIVTVVLAVIGYFMKKLLIVSDIFFMIGLILLCLAIADILLHASLMSGWFQHQRKGETNEEYQERKIDVHEVADRKNRPVHFDRFSVNSLVISIWLIICAVLVTG